MFIFGSIIGFIAGGALIWFSKDSVTSIYKTTEDQIGALNDKIKKLKGE